MENYLKQTQQSEEFMETENIKKNEVSQKKLMSKRIKKMSFIISFFILMIILQSCGSITLRGNHANLTDNSTYKSLDLQMTSSFERFNLELFAGAAQIDVTNSYLDYSFEEKEEASKPSLSVGLGGTYYIIQKKRLQPFISFEFLDIPFLNSEDQKSGSDNEKKIKGYYFTATPKVGARFFLSNSIALSGSLGYQMGTLKINEQKSKLSGFTPSVGIVFILANML